jgi:hypothetical protein
VALVTLLVALLAVVGVVGVVVALVLLTTRGGLSSAPSPSEAAAASRRHGIATHVTAWVVPQLIGPVVLLLLMRALPPLGIWHGAAWNAALAGLFPAVLGLLFLATHAVGELTWPRPTGMVRRAALQPRRRRDVVPVLMHRVVWGLCGALVLALVVLGATAEDGRMVVASEGSVTMTASPYPGWYYGVPLLVAAVLLVAACEGVLHLVARRPAVVDADPTYDAASRRLSAHRALRGVELLLAGILAAVLVLAGSALRGVGHELLGPVVMWLGVGVALAGVVLAMLPAAPAVPSPVPGAGGAHGLAGTTGAAAPPLGTRP